MNDFTLKVKSRKIKSMPITKHGAASQHKKKRKYIKTEETILQKKKGVNLKSAKFKLKKGYDNKF